MTPEMLLITAVRLAGSLPVLRWPFYGGLLALLVDQSDLFIMNLVNLGGIDDYQLFDKYVDQVYLLAFLAVALRWDTPWREVSVALYVHRLAGFVAFEATGERDLLLAFPNLFEFWFLLVAGLKTFRLEDRVRGATFGMAAGALLALKLFQEYAIHHARWLDGFTAVEAVEAVWRWLTGPFS